MNIKENVLKLDTRPESVFDLGFYLLLFIWLLFTVSTALFLIGVSISIFNFVFSSLLTLYLSWKFVNTQYRKSIIFYLVFITLLCILFSVNTVDLSWDGNTYHKTTAGMLKEGWNPIYAVFDDLANRSGLFSQTKWPTWFDAYPKASPIIGACLYALTGNIESGKLFTLMTCISGSMICYALCTNFVYVINKKLLFCLVLLLFFNPISITQMVTYYNDAFLWSLLFITFFCCLSLSYPLKTLPKNKLWLTIFMCIGIGLNLKFSALLYFAIVCFFFFVFWIYRCVIEKNYIFATRITLFFVASLVFALIFLGSTSYIKNQVLHNNPLYTVIGENKTEVVDLQTPKSIQSMSHIERFGVSLFSVSSNYRGESYDLKVPFTIRKSEASEKWIETRLGGWGVLFSGTIVFSLIGGLLLCIRKKGMVRLTGTFLILMSFVPPFIIPGLFWARHWMVLFIIPVLVSIFLFENDKLWSKLLGALIVVSLTVNNFLPLNQLINTLSISQKARMEYLNLANISNTKALEIKLGDRGPWIFSGLVFTLRDNKIKNFTLNDKLVSNLRIADRSAAFRYKVIGDED